MIRRNGILPFALVVVASVSTFNLASNAQAKRLLVTQKIDNSKLTTLVGNTRPEANMLNDRGPVSADLQMDHMLLLLKRPAELDAAATKFVDDLHNPKSANFHKWISAAQFGQMFGPAASDVAAVTGWLADNGFTVNLVYSNHMFIDFSGTASQIEAAFHTQIRNYEVNGETHIANANNPQIPAALAGVVAGPVSLNNFRPRAMHSRLHGTHIEARSGQLRADYTPGNGDYPIVPYDLAKIYNIAPLFSSGISGQGMKIVVVEDTNLWNCNPTHSLGACTATSDWAVFRNSFGLSKYTAGNLSQVNPAPQVGTNNCTIPSTGSGYPAGSGINTDDVEAAIDVMWATAAAPNASIVNAACRSTTVFGGTIAIQNILSHPNADNVDVISMSYGESEAQSGATLNASFNTTFQQAVAQGVGIFVSSGDELAASAGVNRGIGISGWMSSQYDVSVGGLDYADTYLGLNSTYWNSTNNAFYGSAKSYIMEQPWNDSCAGVLLANYETGSYITYGLTGFCNTTTGGNFHNGTGGSGGPSGCATGAPTVSRVVSGTCAGYAKPSYQSAYLGTMAGLVNDSVRDTPDVSLLAANGLWGHYFPICYTNTTPGGLANGGIPSCTTVAPVSWPGYGGTSVSSPIMAAIQALVVQHKGSLQGNPNPRYYALANAEYGPTGSLACDSSKGNAVGSSCIFYDVTMGDIDAYCTRNSNGNYYNCYHPGTTTGSGVLSTSNTAYQPAYPTGPAAPFTGSSRGWDFATGIGSVNAYNLVMQY